MLTSAMPCALETDVLHTQQLGNHHQRQPTAVHSRNTTLLPTHWSGVNKDRCNWKLVHRHHELTLNAQQLIDAKNKQELEIKFVVRGVSFKNIFPAGIKNKSKRT